MSGVPRRHHLGVARATALALDDDHDVTRRPARLANPGITRERKKEEAVITKGGRGGRNTGGAIVRSRHM